MARLLLVSALAIAAVAQAAIGQAIAADLPEPSPPPRAPATYIPTVAPVYNWGGIYYGVNGGYAFGKSEWTTTSAVSAVTTGDFNASGFAIGGTVGANVQADAFVFGVEGDIDWMGVDGKSNLCAPVNCETKSTYLSTLRARAGYAADRVLFYGTAGGAFGNMETNTIGTSFQEKSKAGWTAGAGVEVAFTDNWTARIEYLFVDLQNASFTSQVGGAAPGPAVIPATTSVKLDENLIRLGVDYKFR